ncbi:MAG: amino acid ABC transporter permease [Acutalibacteraceae bacterium]|nr:amino acid ABC transporter permease [Acutalibacteraceae bacterium]
MSFQQVSMSLAVGFLENCRLFFETLLFSIPLGLLICFGSMSKFKPLRYLIKTFVWIIRGTPLMLQLFIVFYVPGLIFGIPMRNRMLAALIAFVINYGCYFSEIFRGGLESLPKGQYEAGQVLGLTKAQIFFKIVLLQVVKRIVPPMSNEIITLVKDTSLARVIAVGEILMSAERFAGKGLIWPLFYTGLYFLLFNGLLTILFGYVEKKLNYFKS